LWLQSALWLAPLALLLAYGYEDPTESPLDLNGVRSHRAVLDQPPLWFDLAGVRDHGLPPLLRADPVRFALIPVAIAAACFAVLLRATMPCRLRGQSA
jgi:hypothetical protein